MESQSLIDSAVRELNLRTQDLRKAFMDWSTRKVDERVVSKAFVDLGNVFLKYRAQLETVGIYGLVNVPNELRPLLETALGLDPVEEVYNEYDPQIGRVMANLFQQLKDKRRQLPPPRAVPSYPAPSPESDTSASKAFPSRANRRGSDATHVTAAVAHAHYPRRRMNDRSDSRDIAPSVALSAASNVAPSGANVAPSITADMASPTASSRRAPGMVVPTASPHREAQPTIPSRSTPHSVASPSRASPSRAQLERSQHRRSTSQPLSPSQEPWAPHKRSSSDTRRFPENALSQLQRNGRLERQASKRYSTQRVSRIVNGSPSDKILPTTDVHRTFNSPDFSDSSVLHESLPRHYPRRPVGSPAHSRESSLGSTPLSPPPLPSRRSQTPSSFRGISESPSAASAADPASVNPASSNPAISDAASADTADSAAASVDAANSGPNSTKRSESPIEEAAPDPTLTVFLRLGKTVRKGSVPRPASIAALRLQFVEVCAYVPSGEETFPEILVQDPTTYIDYEVTEATIGDVKNGSLLTLNVKGPEETSVENELREIRECLKELAQQRPAAAANRGKPQSPGAPHFASKFASPVLTGDGKFVLEKAENASSALKEVEAIRTTARREISECRAQITALRTQLRQLASASVTVVSDTSSIAATRARLDQESDEFIRTMEDIADIIDRQRLDVISGGYRYSDHELDQVRRKLKQFQQSFRNSEQFLRTETPVWKRVWQTELNEVIEAQEWVKNLATLYNDLRGDLEQSVQMFGLVCEANKMPRISQRPTPLTAPPIEPGKEALVADAMFNEIQGLNLNSDSRTEAIQRAERHIKAKQALRTEEFEAELDGFVADSKLKKRDGGFEAVEQMIRERELEARKLGEQSEIEGKRLAELAREERRKQKKLEKESKARGEAVASEKAEASEPKVEKQSAAAADELSAKVDKIDEPTAKAKDEPTSGNSTDDATGNKETHASSTQKTPDSSSSQGADVVSKPASKAPQDSSHDTHSLTGQQLDSSPKSAQESPPLENDESFNFHDAVETRNGKLADILHHRTEVPEASFED